MTDEQKNKLIAATKRAFARMRAISRKHRGKITKLLSQVDEKHIRAIQAKIGEKM